MLELEVLDVDALGAEGLGDPGEHAGLVGNVDADAVERARVGVGGLEHPAPVRGRLADPAARKPASRRSSAASTCSIRRRTSASSSRTASALSRNTSIHIRGFAPAIRVMSRREPPALASGVVALDPALAGAVDDHVREHVRNVADQRDQPVVRRRVDRDRERAELGDERVDEPVALGVGCRRRCQEPGRAFEEPGRGALGAPALRAGHRMAADEARRAGGRRRAPLLRRGDVGDGRPVACRCEHGCDLRGSSATGAATTASSAPSSASSSERCGLDRAPRGRGRERVRVGIPADDGDAARPRGKAERGADQPGADNREPRELRGGAARAPPHQLGEAKGKVERLAPVQPWVAEGLVAGVELLLGELLGAAETLGHVVARVLEVDAARPDALGTAGGEEALDLAP